MQARTIIAIGIAVASVVALAAAKWDGSGLALNLATEFIGIGVTVIIIDWLLERRRLAEAAQRLASVLLHRLDHHVWVWQGGAREFDFAELQILLDEVDDSDPLPAFTQTLFLRLGSDAAAMQHHLADIVRANAALARALQHLTQLQKLRDVSQSLRPCGIAQHARAAAEELARAARISGDASAVDYEPSHKNASVKAQRWRHYGSDEEA